MIEFTRTYNIYKGLIMTVIIGLMPALSLAQCSMCRAVVESDLTGQGGGINNAIIYLMIFPYAMVALLAYLLYKKYKRDQTLTSG